VATVSAALRAASTLGRFAVEVIDWKSAYVRGMKGRDAEPRQQPSGSTVS
jgi:hypothetical protein